MNALETIYNNIPFLRWLKDKHRVRVVNTPYIEHLIVDDYVVYPDNVDAPTGMSIVRQRLSQLQYSGDFVFSKEGKKGVIEKMQNKINYLLFRSERSFIGLDKFISTSPETETIYGINRATKEHLRNNVSIIKYCVYEYSKLLYILKEMYVKCTQYENTPDILICHPGIYEWIKLWYCYNPIKYDLEGIVSWKNNKLYSLNIPIFPDSYCPYENIYFINSNYFEWVYFNGCEFKETYQQSNYNIYFEGCLCCSEFNMHGVITLDGKIDWEGILFNLFGNSWKNFYKYFDNRGINTLQFW